MKRTSAAVLLAFAAAGALFGFGFDVLLTSRGAPTFLPSPWLPVLLVVIGGISLSLAFPVRRSVRMGVPVDPARAVLAAALARASSRLGAVVLGLAIGLFAFLLSRPVAVPVGSLLALVALVVGSAALVTAALIAEYFCLLPKDPDEPRPANDSSTG